jgi:phosphoribosylformylglycinamidine cyclo-ligase
MDKHDTVGQDLVNHCVNDIAVGGAKPLFFMDYLAFGKLVPEKAEQIIKGFSIACKENEVSLIGGETAEMPGLYAQDEYDMSGTIVGVVDKEKIIEGNNIQKGDLLVGFKSSGLHTNGYSLARKVLLSKFSINDKLENFELSLGEELLRIHKSYLKLISRLKIKNGVKAFSHITGGGIIGNTKRVLPKGIGLNVDWNSWEIPPIFNLIKKTGKISDVEMRAAFNLGIGLIAIIDEQSYDCIADEAKLLDEKAFIIGKTE